MAQHWHEELQDIAPMQASKWACRCPLFGLGHLGRCLLSLLLGMQAYRFCFATVGRRDGLLERNRTRATLFLFGATAPLTIQSFSDWGGCNCAMRKAETCALAYCYHKKMVLDENKRLFVLVGISNPPSRLTPLRKLGESHYLSSRGSWATVACSSYLYQNRKTWTVPPSVERGYKS